MTRIRVASHVHSDWSYDGRFTLNQIADGFARRGYDAVLVSEHDRGFDIDRWAAHHVACAEASRPRMLLVPGIEYSDPTNTVHIPVWGADSFLGAGLPTGELLPRVSAAGGLAILAHPGRRDVLDALDPEWVPYLTGIEIWNRKYDGYAPNPRAVEMLRTWPQLLPVVSLDFHTPRQFHPLAMVLELGGELSPDTILDAIQDRRAYGAAFGVPAVNLTRGFARSGMYGVERARKNAAALVRRMKRFAHR